MFAVGHIALGYLTGKILSKLSNVEMNIPAIMTLSLLPDIDLIIPGLQHRGPTHSIAFIIVSSIFIIIYSRRESLPYIGALAGHTLIGDSITGATQLYWPFSTAEVSFGFHISMESSYEIFLETSLLVLLLGTIYFMGDLGKFMKPRRNNRLLFIPLMTIILPAFFYYPIRIPTLLIPQHILLFGLIGLSLTISIFKSPETPVDQLKRD
jgi:membrane-bound metal-dependent hydrolase YbcI (DUF457 family)